MNMSSSSQQQQAGTAGGADALEQPGKSPILASPPVLQHPTASGMTVVWAVNGPATGWVEYGLAPQQLTCRATAPHLGLEPLAEHFISVRIEGLDPGQQVFYRVVSVPIHFSTLYRVAPGLAQCSNVYSFKTLDPQERRANFLVVSDTHEQAEVLQLVGERLKTIAPDLLIWNGDIFSAIHSDQQLVDQVLRPLGAAAPHAAERPVLFAWGNHDVRGPYARAADQAIRPWPVTALQPQGMGKCFAVRHGPVALIGLDTGEDKPDAHPLFAGLARFEPYRQAQAQWLESQLRDPVIRSAPWLVVFCHIPLWGLAGENPGDTLEGYAWYCRQAQRAWHPVLQLHDAQLVISGHLHEHRHLPPEGDRRYAQLVIGSPEADQATCLRGEVKGKHLEIWIERLADGQVLERLRLPPRRSGSREG